MSVPYQKCALFACIVCTHSSAVSCTIPSMQPIHQLYPPPPPWLPPGDATPAPSTYTLPTMLGERVPHRASSAAYSMLGRPKVGGFSDDNKHTPAPNVYKVTDPDLTQRKQPAYTMRSRVYMPGGWCKSTQ